jgi:stearoyl-CoA desaturase (delta-9 desaturase)
VLSAALGLVHAHVGWLFSTKGMERGPQYARDLYEDRMVRWIDRLYLLWVALTLGIPFAIGYAHGGATLGAELLVWAGLVRIFAFQHVTFSINSICHAFGRRAYVARDESRNVWYLAPFSFGESWHNNHHAFPSSARHGLDRGQLDLAWWSIRGLERAGLVWDVKHPSERQRERRRIHQV